EGDRLTGAEAITTSSNSCALNVAAGSASVTRQSRQRTTKHERKNMNNQFDKPIRSKAQSQTRCGALEKFRAASASIALAALLAATVATSAATLSPLIELSQPNPVGGCDDGFRLPGTWTINDAAEPYAVVNPINPNNVVASW